MNVQLFTNKHWGNKVECVPGVIDDAAIEAFSYGHCHVLALALHEATGWPLVAIWYDDAPREDDIPDHVAVRNPSNGKLVDVSGAYYDSQSPDYSGYGAGIAEVELIDDEVIYDWIDWGSYKGITDESRNLAQSIVGLILKESEESS